MRSALATRSSGRRRRHIRAAARLSRVGARHPAATRRQARGDGHALSLLKLGERCFLEVIAIDPDGTTPARPRWFDLDRPAMRAPGAATAADPLGCPRRRHQAARRAGSDRSGPVHAMSRGGSAGASPPDDGARPGAGVLPTLIQWEDVRHPADDMPDAGVRIAALAAAPERVDARGAGRAGPTRR
jgi:hypothetical protein